jgi:hypothetical protein
LLIETSLHAVSEVNGGDGWLRAATVTQESSDEHARVNEEGRILMP